MNQTVALKGAVYGLRFIAHASAVISQLSGVRVSNHAVKPSQITYYVKTENVPQSRRKQ
jgi:hypothetical protein